VGEAWKVDVFLDCAGAPPAEAARVVRRGGQFVTVHGLLRHFDAQSRAGSSGGSGPLRLLGGAIASAGALAETQAAVLARHGVRFSQAVFRPNSRALAHLSRLADAGVIKPFVDAVVPSVEEGFALFQQRRTERTASAGTASKAADAGGGTAAAAADSAAAAAPVGSASGRTHGGKIVIVPTWE
jgi:hypothetical protein